MVYIIHVRSMQHHKCGRPLEIMYLNMLYITVAPGVGLGLMILYAPWPGPDIPLVARLVAAAAAWWQFLVNLLVDPGC